MFNWIKSEIEELKKLSDQKKTSTKEEQVKEARKYFYRPSGSTSLVEAGSKFPLLSAAEIVEISIEESRRFSYDRSSKRLEAKRNQAGGQVVNNMNKYGSPGLASGSQSVAFGNHGYSQPLTPSQSYEDVSPLKISVNVSTDEIRRMSLPGKKDLVNQLREIESRIIKEIREEEEKVGFEVEKVKKRKLI